jgi:phospholipid/cholesterol/gamma-HCH transport system substrate-binding protein
MSRNAIETIMGAVVLVIAGAFVAFAYQNSDLGQSDQASYHVTADFSNVGGVSRGSDVRIGGVKIGVVDDMTLRSDTYQAQLRLAINNDVKLPADTAASIVGDGLLGSKFVALQPGADERMLGQGERIEFTQSSVSLEELIGKFVFSAGGVDKEEPAAPAASSSEPSLSVP